MDDTPSTPQPLSRLRVLYDPATQSPCLQVDDQVYTVDPATAEGIAKGLFSAVAMAHRARSAELN